MVRILFYLVMLAPVSAIAAQVCHEIPEGVSYASIQTNFDNSVTITAPKVFVNGAYVYLYPDQNTSIGFCKFLDKAHVQTSINYLEDVVDVAFMSAKGKFAGSRSSEKIIAQISCREKQVP